jgi:hypothetical protein
MRGAGREIIGRHVVPPYVESEAAVILADEPRILALGVTARQSSGHGSSAAGEDADDRWLEVEGLDACLGEAGLAESVDDLSSGLGRGLLGGARAAWLCGDGDASAWPEQGA